MYGDREDRPQYVVECKLVADLRHRRCVLWDKQRAPIRTVYETDRADVAVVREPDVIAVHRPHRHWHLVLHSASTTTQSCIKYAYWENNPVHRALQARHVLSCPYQMSSSTTC